MYLDMHSLGRYTKEELIRGLEEESDEFGVIVHQMLFNEKEDILHCICFGPDIESIKKHHMKFNTKCDKIFPIDQIETEKSIKDRKLETIGELSSRLAHDIRNPLAVIQTSTDILKSKYPEIYEKEIYKFNAINIAINRIKHQINDVLGYLTTRKLDFTSNKITKILESALNGINIPNEIKIERPQNDILLECDFELLRVVCVNILLNAMQAMNDSGKIIIKTNQIDNHVTISFENSGPSIPDKIIEKIFEPLFTTKQEGTGLGLVTCKRIIENHGGKIKVKNNPTTFTIILPQRHINGI
ncbi:MAG: PAS domain-containing sensor histidine kinase [Nitrosarchaeum sp.]